MTVEWLFIKAAFHRSGFSSKRLFIEAAFHRMAFSLNAQFHLVFKTVIRISVALLHPKLLMI
jgi:hypothetical protein